METNVKCCSKLVVFVFLIVALNGCKKGDPGTNGSANVTSGVYSVSSWTYSSPQYSANFSVPDLTSANINTAAIMVYFSNGGNWIALPFTQYNSPYNYFMGFNTGIGNVQVTWIYDTSLSSGKDPNSYYSSAALLYKVVIIPPSVMVANPNLDLKNYKDVKRRFNLTD